MRVVKRARRSAVVFVAGAQNIEPSFVLKPVSRGMRRKWPARRRVMGRVGMMRWSWSWSWPWLLSEEEERDSMVGWKGQQTGSW